MLPGSVQAYYEAPIYARTNGYLRIWYTDIGTPVKKGQLLAEIDTPEVDQQLPPGGGGPGHGPGELRSGEDHQRALAGPARHAVGVAAGRRPARRRCRRQGRRAAVRRRQPRAPRRARVVQARAGALRRGGHPAQYRHRRADQRRRSTSPGSSLFRVADTHRLRIYVYVPQPYAAAIHPDVTATSSSPITRAGATRRPSPTPRRRSTPCSRTLQVELQIDNARGELLPGSYAQVTSTCPPRSTRCACRRIPCCSAPQNLQVATVGSDGTVHLKSITEGRDFGTEIEVLGGPRARPMRLIVNPPDSITDGEQVRVVQPSASAPRSTPLVSRAPAARAALALLLALLAGCSLIRITSAPPWRRRPDSYKEAGDWQPASPADTTPRGRWWSMFRDPDLDALEAQVSDANQSLKAAFATLAQARAQTRIARSAWFPTITAQGDATRAETSVYQSSYVPGKRPHRHLLRGRRRSVLRGGSVRTHPQHRGGRPRQRAGHRRRCRDARPGAARGARHRLLHAARPGCRAAAARSHRGGLRSTRCS